MADLAFTKTTHKTSYPTISPSRPELSCKNKTVIVTGGGSGIGAAAALSFVKAGATKIGLLGRTEAKLLETKTKIESAYPEAEVCIAVADVGNTEAVGGAAHHIRVALGAWDIFVHNAGVFGNSTPLTAADIDEWWSIFETNTKSIVIFAKHFLTKCRLPGATFISVNSEAAQLPAEYLPACSAYSVSKYASVKLTEFLAKENPGLRVFTVNPGFIETAMANNFLVAAKRTGPVEFGDVSLAADFFMWCSSPEADFLRGRFIWSSWDVEEMKEKRSELEKDPGLLRLPWGR